ncbi:MAG TPA: GAF domain-containing protein [Chitinophagaceae bacterium]
MVNILRSKLPQPVLDNMYEKILQQAMTINRASCGNVQILNKHDQSLQIVVSVGLSSQFLDHFNKVGKHDGSVCARALQTRKTVFVPDLGTDEFFAPHLEIARTEGIHSVQSTPLISRAGQLIGIVSIHYKLPRIPDTEFSKFEIFCSNMADMIETYLN